MLTTFVPDLRGLVTPAFVICAAIIFIAFVLGLYDAIRLLRSDRRAVTVVADRPNAMWFDDLAEDLMFLHARVNDLKESVYEAEQRGDHRLAAANRTLLKIAEQKLEQAHKAALACAEIRCSVVPSAIRARA